MGVSVSSAKKSCRACWQTLNGSKRRLEVRQTMRCLAGQMRPCRSVPEVEAWEATFETVQLRCNFLVLDGPSKMGKMLFCRSRALGKPESLLEIDCAGADTPDLMHYEFGTHTMVLCDEGSAEMVLRYKKLFQAPRTHASHPSTPVLHGAVAMSSVRKKTETEESERRREVYACQLTITV